MQANILHKTAVFLILQKGLVQTLAAVQTVTADTARFCSAGVLFLPLSLFPFCYTLWNTLLTFPLILWISVVQHVKQEKNSACSSFKPLSGQCSGSLMWERLVTYCLLLQAHPCSPEETLPSKAVRQSRLVSCCSQLWDKCWSFPLSSYPIPVVMYVALSARTVGGCQCDLPSKINWV